MKLSFEQHNGLGKIARYYEQIESIAEDISSNENVLDQTFHHKVEVKQSQMEIAAKRQQVFLDFKKQNSKSSIKKLNVIINEDRF